MSDLMVLDLGAVALPFDAEKAAELTKTMTAGFGSFKRAARLSMGNSGDWELIDDEGTIHDLGREVNIVIVDQREYVSRIHYAQSYDEMKASGEMAAPDCQSYNGLEPDENVEHKYADKCKGCPAFDVSGQSCGFYRRTVVVLAYEDGTFSDPCVFEPKSKSLFDDTIVQQRYGSYGWYMNSLAKHKRNGVAMPIPTQAVVTRCMPMPKMEVSTIKFGIAPNSAGGYWTLNKEQFEEILALKDSDEVKEMLRPFNAAHNNPSSAGLIPVKDVTGEAKSVDKVEKSVLTKKSPTSKKAPPAKSTPPVKKAKKMVVLGMEHPDVMNSEEYDYQELLEWEKDATAREIKEFLEENFPSALEPVEVEVEAQEPETPPKKSPPRKVAQKVKKQATESEDENVVDTSGESVSAEDKAKSEALADGLDDFDD